MYKTTVSYKGITFRATFFVYGFAHYTLKNFLRIQNIEDLDIVEISKLDFSWKNFLKCLTKKMDVC